MNAVSAFVTQQSISLSHLSHYFLHHSLPITMLGANEKETTD